MQPGEVSQGHTHDLGHEIFLILAGRCEFTIDGESQELGPGQMCVARVDQMHSVRVIGDEPMTMYLSVTPHIQPTHTFWDEEGHKLPPRFASHSAYDQEVDSTLTDDELLSRHVQAAAATAAAATACAAVQSEQADSLRQAMVDEDWDTAAAARNAMWAAISDLHRRMAAQDTLWNELAPRAVK